MILQELFKKYNYINIMDKNIENYDNLKVSFFLDEDDEIPTELIGIYISKNKDELFLVLDTTGNNPIEMCNKWDEKIAIFIMFGSEDKKALKKLKYNIIQLVIYQDEIHDRSEEGSVRVSRKIFIPYKTGEDGQVTIEDGDALEIPFCLFTPNNFQKNNSTVSELKKITQADDTKMNFIKKENRKIRRSKDVDGFLKKNFTSEKFELIEEWLD